MRKQMTAWVLLQDLGTDNLVASTAYVVEFIADVSWRFRIMWHWCVVMNLWALLRVHLISLGLRFGRDASGGVFVVAHI